MCASSLYLFSQEIRHLNLPANLSCFNCDSSNVGEDIFEIQELSLRPFDNIFQMSVKYDGGIRRYSTISFISENCMVTNRHCLEYFDKIELIEVGKLSGTKVKWFVFDKSDFEILYYGSTFSSFDYDLALIKINNTNKLKKIFKSSFSLMKKDLFEKCQVVKVSGYPFIKFAINSKAPDTLVCRSIEYDQVEFNKNRTMIGYPLCTCPGDSGAPIWFEYGSKFYIIGIHQGSRSGEKGFINRQLNVGIFFNDDVTDWILSKVKL